MSKRQRLMDQDWGLSSSSSSSSSSSDSSSDEEEITPVGPSGLLKLPFEILSKIFIYSSNPDLPITSQHFYRQLYYCHNTIKLAFFLHRNHNNVQLAFEEAVRFPFFNQDLWQRFDKHHKTTYQDKKIPARLFLQEPLDTQQERDAMILSLLERGASPNRPKGFPLIKSAQLGRLDTVKRLVAYGADPTLRNNMALRVCAARNNRPMVDYFLDELKVKPDSETLGVCVKKKLWDMFHLLVDHGAVPDMSTINAT
jgi:ankyrin repeat protein